MKTLIKNNKGLFILPLLALPFVILIFYILGGGKGNDPSQSNSEATNGANYQLPDANRDIKILDKKEAYQQVQTDDTPKLVELDVDTSMIGTPIEDVKNLDKEDATEVLMQRIKQQEERSRQAINNSKAEVKPRSQNTISASTQKESKKRSSFSNQKRRNKQESQSRGQSIELEELQDLLNEHEQLIRQKDSMQRQLQEKQVVLSRYERLHNQQQAGFELKVKITGGFDKADHDNKPIQAQVVEDSKVMTGNRIMLRLLRDMEINGQQVKANTIVYGLCKTDNERLQIQISSISVQGHYQPVNLSVFDMDGIKGLYVPDNVPRKIYQDVASDIKPSLLLTTQGDPLTAMGVNTASDLSKNMMKRIKQKKVYLRRNTVVILKNN